jgi:hypothetical protein
MKTLYKCEYCEFYTYESIDCEIHARQEQQSKLHEKKHSCPKCNYKSAKLCNLKTHLITVHSKLLSFFCEHCPSKVFNSKNYVRSHYLLVHQKRKKCHHCKKRIAVLRHHVKQQICFKCKKFLPCAGQYLMHHRKLCAS